MLISVKTDQLNRFDGEEYEIDLDRKFEGYAPGDLIISGAPFDVTGVFPLSLEIAIQKNGTLTFRSWDFGIEANNYFHVRETVSTKEPTAAQVATVNGLFSGRLTFEGLRISIGSSVQKLCPIDVKLEEDKTGRKLYVTD